MTDFAQWRQSATIERQQGRVCFDREALSSLHDVLRRLREVGDTRMLDDTSEAIDLAEQAKVLDARVAESTETFEFVRIPPGRWRELEDAHPATDAQRDINPDQTVDPTTAQPAIAAECCASPGLSIDDAEWLYGFLPDDAWGAEVWTPILIVNKAGTQAPKGVSGIADRLITGLKSITPPPEESHSPSSEGE